MRVLGNHGWPSATAPASTITAIAAAMAIGADGVQVDVRLTADCVPVCSPTDVISPESPVQIQDLDFASLQNVLLPGGHRVPSLDDVIDFVSRRGLLVINVPQQSRRGELTYALRDALRHLSAEDVTVLSSEDDTLRQLRRLLPRAGRAGLASTSSEMAFDVAAAVRRGDSALHISVDYLRAQPQLVKHAHRHGLLVGCYTGDVVDGVREMATAGVDAIITDVPQLVVPALAGLREASRRVSRTGR